MDRAGFELKAAALLSEVGRPADALAAYEALLDRFEPDAWQAAEARAGAERALAGGGPGAAADWYRRRVADRPGEVASSVRLAELLADAGETAEATDRLRAVIAAAPSDPRPRRALAGLLTDAGAFAAAADHYARLADLLPGDADVIRAWGEAVLNDPGSPRPEAVGKAAAVWERWLAGRPDDAAAHARVAGWLRGAGADGRALTLERRAADLAPDDPGFAATLAERLHALGRGEEAVAAWRRTAAGPNRTPANLARLAGTLAANGYGEEAAGVAADAVALAADGGGAFEPLTFGDRLALAGVFAKAGRADAAADQLAAAEIAADTPDRRGRAAREAVAFARDAGTLEARLAALAAAAETTGAAGDFARLARFRDAAGDAAGAAEAAEAAVAADPADDDALALAADLRWRAARFDAAAEAFGTLAARDRRGRPGHLARRVEALLKAYRRAEAFAVARTAAAESPADAAAWGRLGRAALAAGEDAAGLDALRRAADLAGDETGHLELAAALRGRGRPDDAAAALWRAFAAADGFDRRRAVVLRLAGDGAAPAAVADRLRAEPGLPGGEADRLAAAAFLAAGDPAGAAAALRRRLDRAPGDVAALRLLATIEEDAGRWQSALQTRRRLAAATGDPVDRLKLADLLAEADEIDAAVAEYRVALPAVADPAVRLTRIDRFLAAERFDAAFALAEADARPDDWERLYREAFAAARGGAGPAVAAAALRRLWELDLPANTPATVPAARVPWPAGFIGRAEFARGAARSAGFLGLGSTEGAAPFRPPETFGHARAAAALLLARAEPAFAGGILSAAGLGATGAGGNAAAGASPARLREAAGLLLALRLSHAFEDGWPPDLSGERGRALWRESAVRLASRPGAGVEGAEAVWALFMNRAHMVTELRIDLPPLPPGNLALYAAAVEGLRAGGSPLAPLARRALLAELALAGDRDRIAAVAARDLAAAATPAALRSLASALGEARRADAATAAMKKAAALPPADRAAAFPDYFDLAPAILAAAAADDWRAAFAFIDAHAELTAPADPPDPAPDAVRTVFVVVPRRGDRGAVSYDREAVPVPAAEIADDQLALLRSLWRALREPGGLAELAPDGAAPADPGGPAFLLDHLERRAAAATGDAKAREDARAAAVRAWMGES